MRAYRRLPRWAKIAFAATFGWTVVMPIYLADGAIRGAVFGWRDFRDLYRKGMGNLKSQRKRVEG